MSAFDPDYLDRAYNNRARVTDFADYFRRWAEMSAAARRLNRCELDVRYGEGPKQTLDVFPSGGQGAPVMVFVHGGWWRSLDKSDHSYIAPAFTQNGACVVLPNYDLCPAVTIPQIVMQTVAALAWTWRNIARYGGDPQRIMVAGHSAGGHLAAMMLSCQWPLHDRDLPPDLVTSALSISGLYELESIMHTPHVQTDLRLTPVQVAKASPAWLPRPASGELYTVVGGDESVEFLRHNQLIQQAWGRQSVPVCEALPGLNHFSVVEALVEPGHRLHQLALELL